MSDLFGHGFEFFNLLDKVSLFVVELFVVLTVVVELGQEVDQLVLISKQNVHDGLRLVRIRNENLEKLTITVLRQKLRTIPDFKQILIHNFVMTELNRFNLNNIILYISLVIYLNNIPVFLP